MTSVEIFTQSCEASLKMVEAAASVCDAIRESYPALRSSGELAEVAADLDAIRAGTLVHLPPPDGGGF